MADLVKKIKIKKQDGTFTDYIPIGAEAQNISTADGKSVEYKLARKPYYFNSVADMKSASYLKVGDMVETLGYYNDHDKGAATFEIVSTNTGLQLDNSLYAKTIEDKSEVQYIFPKNWDTLSGDANLIIAYGKSILIDSHREGVKTQLYNMLNEHGVTHLDYAIFTHYHDDHVGNLENLVADGYIDRNTLVYLPTYCDLIATLTGPNRALDYYQRCGVALAPLNNSKVPEEWEVLKLGLDFSITFYNCDPTWFNESGSTNYNDMSTVCLVKHGKNKALYTGDATGDGPWLRAIENGFITESVDLYKIGHHGINNSCKNLTYLVKPTYAVQPSTLRDSQKNNFALVSDLNTLQEFGTKLYSVHRNPTDYIEFVSQVNTMKNTSGIVTTSVSKETATYNIYVDRATNNTVQDGTQDYPYKELPQAISECLRTGIGHYIFHLADGTYCNGHESDWKNKIRFSNCSIEIQGNSEDNTAVVLHIGFLIHAVNLKLSNLTVNTNVIHGIECYGCNIEIDNCIFDGINGVAADDNGISAYQNSIIRVKDSLFKRIGANGVSTHGDSVYLSNVEFNNCGRGVRWEKNSAVFVNNLSFVDLRGDKFYNPDHTGFLYNPEEKLISANLNIASGNVTLAKDITLYNKAILYFGVVGEGTLQAIEIRTFLGETFRKGYTYQGYLGSDLISLTVDSSDGTKITISRTDQAPTLNFRSIYAKMDDFRIL